VVGGFLTLVNTATADEEISIQRGRNNVPVSKSPDSLQEIYPMPRLTERRFCVERVSGGQRKRAESAGRNKETSEWPELPSRGGDSSSEDYFFIAV
jgi:hypothetical protein